MTTRWFVEVSRVDADTQKEKYCVEALQWQQALQQARKLRGDRGALSRFAIELLESGYRATDPGSRLRYTINKAPYDAPLSSNPPSNGAKVSGPIGLTPTAPPAQAAPAVSEPPKPSLPRPAAHGTQPQAPSTPPKVSAVPTARQSGAPEVPRRNNVVTSPAIPKPRRSQRPPKVQVKKPASVTPPAMASGSDLPPPVANAEPAPSVEPPALTPTTELTELDPLTSPPPETEPNVPGLELVAMRKEEPTDAVPITYREYSFAVAEGTDPEELEQRARAAWEHVRAAIGHLASQKFVQIALFDHRFEGRPLRPPIVVLVWKDWRGDPVVQVRGAPTPPATAPYPPTSLRPGAPGLTAKASFPAPGAPSVEPPRPAMPAEPAPQEPAPIETAAAVVEAAPIADAAPAPVPVEAAVPAPAASFPAAPAEPAPVAAAPAEAPAAPAAAEPVRGKTPSRPGSSPGITSRKKRVSEDLIGELFEQMHQLHFMPDMVAGAEYVLGVILRVMPSEGILIHVFDINTRQFVVVRASGPNARGVLLHRTPDTFKLFRDVFRRSSAAVVADASADANFHGGRWERLGVTVKSALCGAVKQGGRYLGVIELANAAGGAPFQVSEVNALDYICGQFADFVASKPLVIDDDAVLPRT